MGEATEVVEPTRSAHSVFGVAGGGLSRTIADEHSYAAISETDFNLEEFIQIKPSCSDAAISSPEHSDAGYESWGSPQNDDFLNEFNDIFGQSFSELFPELL